MEGKVYFGAKAFESRAYEVSRKSLWKVYNMNKTILGFKNILATN